MGWNSGSELAEWIMTEVEEFGLDHDVKVAFFTNMINKFEDFDCDVMYELLDKDPAYDEAYKLIHSEEYEED